MARPVSVVHRTAAALRAACRSGAFTQPTAGQAPGFVQANLVALRREHVESFWRFCAANAAPCPLLEVTEPGAFEAPRLAPGSDLRFDLPKYRIWIDGELKEERTSVEDLWDEDMQGFLLGCSFSWEGLLAKAGLPARHTEEGGNVPMFTTSIPLKPEGPFHGSMVVSMRPYRPEQVAEVAQITSEFPAAHGAPVHIGDPVAIGIADCMRPDHGDPVNIRSGEVPVFWACGVTPAIALQSAKLPFAITHAPGHMFVADTRDDELKSWAVPGRWSARPAEEPAGGHA